MGLHSGGHMSLRRLDLWPINVEYAQAMVGMVSAMGHLTFRFRAHLLRDQFPILDQWLSDLTSLWNHAGEVRPHAWKKEQRRLSFTNSGRMLLDWPAWEKKNHSNGLSEMLIHMDRD